MARTNRYEFEVLRHDDGYVCTITVKGDFDEAHAEEIACEHSIKIFDNPPKTNECKLVFVGSGSTDAGERILGVG